jgi:hypothetical protein
VASVGSKHVNGQNAAENLQSRECVSMVERGENFLNEAGKEAGRVLTSGA